MTSERKPTGIPSTHARVNQEWIKTDRLAESHSNVSLQAPDVIIFIYGIEVTSDVISYNYTHNVDGEPGTASITLDSPRDKWIVTPRNIGVKVMSGNPRSEEPLEDMPGGDSKEVASSQELVRSGTVDGQPGISQTINATGGAAEHAIGITDPWKNELAEAKLVEQYKRGKVPVRKLTKLTKEGLETGIEQSVDGRFIIDPFMGVVDMGIDDWRGIIERISSQPEIFKYSEINKALIWLIKSNVLYTYPKTDAQQAKINTSRNGDGDIVDTFSAKGQTQQTLSTETITFNIEIELGQIQKSTVVGGTESTESQITPDNLKADSAANLQKATDAIKAQATIRGGGRKISVISDISVKQINEDKTVSSQSGDAGNISHSVIFTVYKGFYSQTWTFVTELVASDQPASPPTTAGVSQAGIGVNEDVAFRHVQMFQPGEPIFTPLDPVRIFERTQYHHRFTDEDGQPFDDYVYVHAFTGFVEATSISGSADSRQVTVTARCMKSLLDRSKLAAKPAVVNERNLGVSDGFSVLQHKFALLSTRDALIDLIQSKGPTDDPKQPLRVDVFRAEKLGKQLTDTVAAAFLVITKALDRLTQVPDTLSLSTWLTSDLKDLTKALADTYGVNLRILKKGNRLGQTNKLIQSSFSGKVNGSGILNGITLQAGFLNLTTLGTIKSGANLTAITKAEWSSIVNEPFDTAEEGENLFRDAISVTGEIDSTGLAIIVWQDSLNPAPDAAKLGRLNSIDLKKLQSSPDNQGVNVQIQEELNRTGADVLVSRDQAFWIDPDTGKYFSTSTKDETQKAYTKAFTRCISKVRSRIFPYKRSQKGVGDYGIRIATILGAKDGDGRPDLAETAKLYQSIWELHDMHPRYRNAKVVRETFGILPQLVALPMAEFEKLRSTQDTDSITQELEKLLGGIENPTLTPSLVEKFLGLARNYGASSITNVNQLNELTRQSESALIKSTVIDALVKSEVENGYLYILEPQGFIASDFHPYNPMLGDISLFETDFKSRLEIIQEICQNIGFFFYSTPRGDFVLQPPMFPFSGRHFSTATDEKGNTPGGSDQNSGRIGAGLFNRQYIWNDSDITGTSVSQDSSGIINVVEVNGSFKFLGTTDSSINPFRAVISRSDLIDRYGVRYEPLQVPGENIHGQDQAAAYAFFRLQQINRESRTLSVDGVNCPTLLVARPIEIPREYLSGYVRSIAVNYSPGSARTVSMELMDLRRLTLAPREGTFVLMTDFDKIEYLNYVSFWADRLSPLQGTTNNTLTIEQYLKNQHKTPEEISAILKDPFLRSEVVQATGQLLSNESTSVPVEESISFKRFDVAHHLNLSTFNNDAARRIKMLLDQ